MYVNQTTVSACGTVLPWLLGSLTAECGQAGGPEPKYTRGPPEKVTASLPEQPRVVFCIVTDVQYLLESFSP